MSDSTFEYPRDDFGIPVEVGVETFTGVDAIVVVHQQDSVGVRREIEVARDGEGLAGIEPPAPEDVPLGTRNDLPRRHGPDRWLAHRDSDLVLRTPPAQPSRRRPYSGVRSCRGCQSRRLTALATTRLRMTIDNSDCDAIASFARRDSGITSVGLKAVALVRAR